MAPLLLSGAKRWHPGRFVGEAGTKLAALTIQANTVTRICTQVTSADPRTLALTKCSLWTILMIETRLRGGVDTMLNFDPFQI